MPERDQGRHPEKPSVQLIPLADLEQASNGRFLSGIHLPPYLDGEIGVDLDRLTQVCDFVNLRQIVILPMTQIRDGGDVEVSSINPDGSATGINVTSSATSVYSNDLFRDMRANGGYRQTHMWADAVVRIDTERIAQILSRRQDGITPSLFSANEWAKEVDTIVKSAIKDLGIKNVADTEIPATTNGMITFSSILGLIQPFMEELTTQKGNLAESTLQFIAYITLFNIANRSMVSDLENTHWQPSILLGNKYDRAFIHSLRLRTGRPIVRPILPTPPPL